MNKISQQELDKMKHLIGFGASDNVSQVNNKPIVEFCAKAADGNTYGIVREFNKFYIKVAPKKNTDVLAEDYQYIGGFSGRKENEYKSYALAAKQFDLKMMSINESCAAKDRKHIQTPKIVDAEWQINETKEMRTEINRLKEITVNVDNILGESNIIGGFAQEHTLPEAPAKSPSERVKNAPFTDKATANGDKDFKIKSNDHKKVGKPFENDGEEDNSDMQSDKNKKKKTDAKYTEKAKYAPKDSIALQNPKGAKAVKMNEAYGNEHLDEDGGQLSDLPDEINLDMDDEKEDNRESEKEAVANEFSNIKKVPAFTFEDGDYVGVEYDKNTNMLYAGGISNGGMSHDYQMEYDLDVDMDVNLQNFYEEIENIKRENGDYDEENVGESKNRNRKSVKLTMEQAAAWARYNHFIDEGCCGESNINFNYELPFPDVNESEGVNEDCWDGCSIPDEEDPTAWFTNRKENQPPKDTRSNLRRAKMIAQQQIKKYNRSAEQDDIKQIKQWEKDKFKPEDLEPDEEESAGLSIKTESNNVAESYVLSDFGKHPSYRKKPMTTPPNKEVSKYGRDWNDNSAKGEEPFGKKIGSSAPYDDVINMLTDAIMSKLDLKKKG